MISSKALVRKALSRKPIPRPPFLPIVHSSAAQLEQISIRDLFASPDALARTMWNAQKLFGYDWVVIFIDPTLEAEACGCPIEWQGERPVVAGHPFAGQKQTIEHDLGDLEKKGRLPVILEAIKRLSLTSGRNVALAVTMNGPLTLAQHLSGRANPIRDEDDLETIRVHLDFAAKVMARLVRAYCELRPDVVVVAEPLLRDMETAAVQHVSPFLRPVWNVVRFYSAYSIIHTDCHSRDRYRALANLGAHGVVGTPSVVSDWPAGEKVCPGVALPLSFLSEDETTVREQWRTLQRDMKEMPRFLTTESEVPVDVPPEKMKNLVQALRVGLVDLQILKGKKILVVDDEPDILDVVKEELSDCEVTAALDFDTAHELIKSHAFDLAILDIMGVNGFALLEAARNRKTPAAMLTADAISVEAVNLSIRLGAVSFLPKDELARLPELIAEILGSLRQGKSHWEELFQRLGLFFKEKLSVDWKDLERPTTVSGQ